MSTGWSRAVDSTIAVGTMFVLDPAKVTATVRVAKFTVCDVGLVVTPVVISIAQSVPATIMLSPAVKVMVAPAVLDCDGAAVKVVVPHPLTAGERVAANVKSGKTRAIVSDTLNATLSAKDKETAEPAAVTGLATVSLVTLNSGVGGSTVGEVLI